MFKKFRKSIVVACAAIMSTYSYSQSYCGSNPVNVHGELSVSGNRIVDQNNSTVSFAGNSMFWSNEFFGAERFYNANVVSSLKDDWGATIVRAAMGVDEFGGFLTYPNENRARVRAVVDAAIAEGMYVIIDWHSHHAEDYRQQSIDFFREMATLYGDHPNVIYEIYNEPINSSWSNDIKPYAEAVISEIRSIDPDNLIIVGTPFFSQNVDVASNDPIRTSTNIAYTLHFYAGTHGAELRSRAQTALNNGVALMVTEWGTVNANGDGGVNRNSTNEWMDFLEANDISHLNWSVHDKQEGASILQPGASSNGNWPDSSLTESGLFVRDIIQNWEQNCVSQPTNTINTNTSRVVHIRKRSTPTFAIDGGNGGAIGQNVYLWSENENNVNQQWIEIDRGNGYYTYQKMGTNFAIDGGNGGATNQNVYLWTMNANNQNQHWLKVDVGGGAFRLIKRNSTGFAINGGSNGVNGQNVNLFDSSHPSQNLEWFITPINGLSAKSLDVSNTNKIVIYPNPIETTTTITGAANSIIHIYDMNGKRILVESILSDNENLDLNNLASGMYYAQIIGEETTSTIKLVKQ